MEELKEHIEKLMTESTEFQSKLLKARTQASETFKTKEPDGHFSARLMIDGLIANTSKQLTIKIEEVDEKVSYQIGLSVSFIRTHFLIHNMILNGDLIEAMLLIRKNFENITRIKEVSVKEVHQLLKKTPNVNNTFPNGGKSFYSELSEIAHFGTPRVAELLHVFEDVDGRIGPCLFPVYHADSIAVLERNIYVSSLFLCWFVPFLKTMYNEKYDSEFDEINLSKLLMFAEMDGIVKRKKEEDKNNEAQQYE